MSLFNRITTWAAGQILKAADLNGEFNGVINTLNNLDGATATWTNVKATTLTSVTTTALKGTVLGDDAAAGNVGEYVTGTQTTLINTGSNGQYKNVTSISLTAGDWDVEGTVQFDPNTGTSITVYHANISAFANNTLTDLVLGVNDFYQGITANSSNSISVTRWRVNITSTATYYLKGMAAFGGGQPQFAGNITARRVR